MSDPRAVLVDGIAAGCQLLPAKGEDPAALMAGVVVAEGSRKQIQLVSDAGGGNECWQRPPHRAAKYLRVWLRVQRIAVPLLGKALAGGEDAERVGLPAAELRKRVDFVVERLPCQGWVRSEVLRLGRRQLEGEDCGKEQSQFCPESSENPPAAGCRHVLHVVLGDRGQARGRGVEVLLSRNDSRPARVV